MLADVKNLISHPLLTLAAQVLLGLLTGNWIIGGLLAVAFFIGRELAQAEYRWIEKFGKRFDSPAEYAEWHWNTYGQYEGRPFPPSWDAYFYNYEDLRNEYAKLSGLRSKMPWWGGFDPRVWQLHSILNLVLPIAVAVAVGVIA